MVDLSNITITVDPAGSIIISIGVIIVWVITLQKQFIFLGGISTVEKMRKKIRKL